MPSRCVHQRLELRASFLSAGDRVIHIRRHDVQAGTGCIRAEPIILEVRTLLRRRDPEVVLYGIPADVKGFAEGELSKESPKFVGGKNLMGTGLYFGPGTPPNTDWHHYTWTLVATDLDPKAPELKPGMTREELAAALKDHVKGSAGLVTRFKHP